MERWEEFEGATPRAPRFPLEFPLRYRASEDSPWRNGHGTNISRSGVLFSAEQPLRLRAPLELDGRARLRLAARMSGRVRPAAMMLILGATVLLAACGTTDVPSGSPPVESVGPGRTVSPAVNQTRIELVRALGVHNLVLTDTQAPVRPAEAALLAAAPRAVYQVLLSKDPSHGYIVVYEFPDPARAAAGAGLPGDRPGARPDTARDRLDHPPGRVDRGLL